MTKHTKRSFKGQYQATVYKLLQVIANTIQYVCAVEEGKRQQSHVEFKCKFERATTLITRGVEAHEYIPPTPDDVLIHTPLSREINNQMRLLVIRLSKDHGRIDAIRGRINDLLSLVNSGGRIEREFLDAEYPALFELIWGDSTINYCIQNRKKNSNLTHEVMATVLASIAYFAGIDNQYQISKKVRPQTKHLDGWLSVPAIAMGLDSARICQMSNSVCRQRDMLYQLADTPNVVVKEADNSETVVNVATRNLITVLKGVEHVDSRTYIARVQRDLAGYQPTMFHETDHNGFGLLNKYDRNNAVENVLNFINGIGRRLENERSVTEFTKNEMKICNARVLTKRIQDEFDVKVSFAHFRKNKTHAVLPIH